MGLTKAVVRVLQKLSVLDVKNLLGTNIQQLKGAENQTAVMSSNFCSPYAASSAFKMYSFSQPP